MEESKEMKEKADYAAKTNDSPCSAWHICSCNKCTYAFALCDGDLETTVNWRVLKAARTAFGAEI